MVSQMDTTPRAALRGSLVKSPVRRLPLTRSVAWLGSLLATSAAVTMGAVLAVFAAAAIAVIGLVAAMLVFLAGLALRARRAVDARQPVLEARRVGHAWVAYGWDRSVP
jgi:uncharacterized membrane protein YhaH (DUF805 family)